MESSPDSEILRETFVNTVGHGSDSHNSNFEVSASLLSHTHEQHVILIKVKPLQV